MSDFKTFSLSDAIQSGQKMMGNNMAIQDAVTERRKSGKAAVLRQRMIEGDHEAFAKLARIDIDQAKKTMDAVRSMEEEEREAFKRQNESIAKGGAWIMQGQSEEEQKNRFDQVISHMESQGMDVSEYKGNFSPQLVQQAIMQSMTIDQMIDATTQTGMHKGVDKDGNPVFFTQNKRSGEPNILKDVKPSKTQVFGNSSGSTRKAADSNAMAKAVGTALGATWKSDGSGGIIYKFKTDKDAKESVELTSKAEAIFRDNPNIGHREAVTRAMKEMGMNAKEEPKTEKKQKSIGDFLDEQRKK